MLDPLEVSRGSVPEAWKWKLVSESVLFGRGPNDKRDFSAEPRIERQISKAVA